jgi:hypothetical protein
MFHLTSLELPVFATIFPPSPLSVEFHLSHPPPSQISVVLYLGSVYKFLLGLNIGIYLFILVDSSLPMLRLIVALALNLVLIFDVM